MRLLMAFVLPWPTYLTIGRPIMGALCLVLQQTTTNNQSRITETHP